MSIHDLLTSCNGSLLYSATKDAISSPRKRKLTHYTCKKQIIQKSQCAEVRLAKVMFELTKSRYITQNRPERRSQSQCHWHWYMSWLLHPTAEHQFQSQVSVSSRWYWLDSDTDAARDRSANKRLRLIMLSADVRCRDGHVCVNRCSFFLFFFLSTWGGALWGGGGAVETQQSGKSERRHLLPLRILWAIIGGCARTSQQWWQRRH